MNPYEQVLANIRVASAEELAADALAQRKTEARAVLQRLPEYLRLGKRAELEGRVHVPAFVEAVRAWEWGHGSLVLMGRSRSGKSTAAGLLFRRLVSRGVYDGGEHWVRVPDMAWWAASDIEAAADEHGRGRGPCPEIGDASRASLLFLDDAGWDRDPRAVSEVLAARYERALPTVVTTGRTREQLIAHYQPAVVSRILEAGGKGHSRVIEAPAVTGSKP